MKRNILTRIGGAVLLIGIGSSLPFLFSAIKPSEPVNSQIPGVTASPIIPDEVTFGGDTIRFDRADLRERMDREQCAFTYMHATTMLILKRANRYFPVVEPILKEEGVPDDFKYLMVIESSLDEQARSSVKASGLWQFMETTARQYGLEVNDEVDERYHIEKATRAACRYLKASYRQYGDWLTVAASYNAGQGRISRELQRQGVKMATDLWLNPETTRYMFRLLAAKEVFSHPQQFGFCLKRSQLYPPLRCTYVEVNGPVASLANFAKAHGLLLRQLKDANPWLRDYSLTNRARKTYRIAIPDSASLHYRPEDTKAHNKNWVID